MARTFTIAFDASLYAAAAPSCDALGTQLTSFLTDRAAEFPRLCDWSLAIGHAPIGVGATALSVAPPVLPICIGRDEVLTGPLYAPGRAACPECLDRWLAQNAADHAVADTPVLAGMLQWLADSPECWLVPWISESHLAGQRLLHAMAIRPSDRRVTRHPVFPRRDCARCGMLSLQGLSSSIHCSRWTGIVTDLELTAGPSAGAYRAAARWSAPLPVGDARPHLQRQDAYGRGKLSEDAAHGCLGEALERYSLIYRGDEQFAAHAPLGDVDGIHPDEIQLFSAAQYRERAGWNASAHDEWLVPDPFDAEAPVDWLPARALSPDHRDRLVPAACCLMWYQFRPGEINFARADTIGCASGVTYDDALTRALLEWIERDAMAIWWDNRIRRPALRLESLDCPELETVRRGLAAIGRDLYILDCTTDIDIPAYVAVAPRGDGTEPLLASAADPSPRVAAYRAASEVGQVWHEARRSKALPSVLKDWLLRETLESQPYLVPSSLADAPEPLSVHPLPLGSAAEPAWPAIVERLKQAGLRAYAVDQSRVDVLLRTVRAVVPGMRHVWNRRAPGRLYDVPVTLGWLARPTLEVEMNPTPGML